MNTRLSSRARTGVPGLDEILLGGLPAGRLYLVDGHPGVGKTTLALQFLRTGVMQGERCVYVTLSETREELDVVAESHGWTLDGITIIELAQIERTLATTSESTLFQPAEVELNSLAKLLLEEFDHIRPQRMVLDSLSELRLMAQNPLRYRRQILSFKQHFSQSDCTVLLLDDSAAGPDDQVHSIVHGMVSLLTVPLKFGINRRYLTVAKLRGSRFREGHHDYVIKQGGLTVFPRLVAADHPAEKQERRLYSSGNPELDALVGGGLHAGTGTLFIGPAGSGKSTVACMFAACAAQHGHRVLYYAFDETRQILLDRARQIGLQFQSHMDSGLLRLSQVDPAEIAPGELASDIVHAVDEGGAEVIILDSLNGYVNAMPQEEFLHLHLHELLTYLNQRNVLTIMILAQHGLIGTMGTPVDVSYLADTVLLMRFYEANGSLNKAVSIVKKRSGPHENTIRPMAISSNGITIGAPLVGFEGVMTGVPKMIARMSTWPEP